VSANRPRCQFTGGGLVVRSVQGTKHRCYLFLPRLRSAKGAVCGQCSRLHVKRGGWLNGKGPRGNNRPFKSSKWPLVDGDHDFRIS